jgi:hypothetical protein
MRYRSLYILIFLADNNDEKINLYCPYISRFLKLLHQ